MKCNAQQCLSPFAFPGRRLFRFLFVFLFFAAIYPPLSPAGSRYAAQTQTYQAPVLNWHTYLGCTEYDRGNQLAIDSQDNIYICGTSRLNWGNPTHPMTNDYYDGFVTKLDANGQIKWNRFLGSDYFSQLKAIKIDAADFIYVAGSSSHFRSPIRPNGGSYDGVLVKIDSNGNIIWHTFLGGSYDDEITDILLGWDGYIYVAGRATSHWGNPANPFKGPVDTFIAKLTTDGQLVSNTFLGSGNNFGIQRLQLGSDGDLFGCGWTYGTFGTPIHAYTPPHENTVAARLDSLGNFSWNTFLGGGQGTFPFGMVLDETDNIYIAGYSYSPWGLPLNPHNGANTDAYLAKLTPDGQLAWHTFIGTEASTDAGAYAMTMDRWGHLYIAGQWIGVPSTEETLVAKMDRNGNRLWKTIVGGIPINSSGSGGSASGIAVGNDGSVTILTNTMSWHANSFGTPIRTAQGEQDCMVAKLTTPRAELALYVMPETFSPAVSETIAFSLLVTNNGPASTAFVGVQFPLPPQLAYQSSETENGSYNPLSGTWMIQRLQNGQSAALDITASIKNFGSLPMTAQIVSQQQVDLDQSNDTVTMDLTVHRHPVLPPTAFNVERGENRSLFNLEYVNGLSWQPNPNNQTTITGYRIYRKPKGHSDNAYTRIAEPDALTLQYVDRHLEEGDEFTYKITAVNDENREGKAVTAGN